jgi:hypothetical protein
MESDRIVKDIIERISATDFVVREKLFQKIREKFCVRCGDKIPDHKCWNCYGRGEDV